MSVRRIVLSSACMALAVGSGGWYATGVFPLVRGVSAQAPEVLLEAGPLERAAEAITPENPVPRRIFSVPAAYPPEGLATAARAIVTLRGAIDARGSVAEVRRIGANVVQADPSPALVDAFVRAAAEALGRWQFDPPVRPPVVIDVNFLFQPGEPDATERMLLPPRAAGIAVGPAGTGTASTGAGGTGTDAAPSAGTPPDPSAQIVRVGGNVREPTRIRHVAPRYPPIAQQARVRGVVIVEAVIGETGHVTYARVLRSIPLLDQAALDAVMQWEFAPMLLNGQAVPVMMTVTINFALD
jgi:TonB family protein